MFRSWLPTLFLLAGLFACASPGLPGYARPKARTMSADAVESMLAGDLVRYRTLAKTDFKSDRPPPQFEPYRDRLRAATCCILMPDGRPMVRVQKTGPESFEARPPRVQFVAYMDRDCSWWNDQQTQADSEYTLQHEQIHFAIFELEARRLTAGAKRTFENLVGYGSTPEEAGARLNDQLYQQLDASRARALDRSTRFDEDTSMGVRIESQAEWKADILRELAESAR